MQSVDPTGTQEQAVSSLAEAAFALLAAFPAARSFVMDRPTCTKYRALMPETLPATRWLADAVALSSPATAPLMAMLADTAADLAWRQTYSAADFGPAFLDRYGWAELLGPSGSIESDAMRCGFLILGPDLHYPSHAHEAEELYLPLAGTALWQRGEAVPAPVPPGAPIHHPSWIPHAMWTRSEPLVAFYCWRGGVLDAKPKIVGRG